MDMNSAAADALTNPMIDAVTEQTKELAEIGKHLERIAVSLEYMNAVNLADIIGEFHTYEYDGRDRSIADLLGIWLYAAHGIG